MTADPYARLEAAYLLGAPDADERLAYEAHLAICRRCRASLAEISAIPPRHRRRDLRPGQMATRSRPESFSPAPPRSPRHRSRTSRSPSPTGAPSSL